MNFEQIYSSSRANLYTVTANNGRRLLLECGVSWSKLQEALNYDLSSIDTCLLTHEHLDHSKAVKEVMKAGIDVCSSAGTFEALSVQDNRRAKAIPTYSGITNKTFNSYAFPIIHDAVEPLGYVVREVSTNEYLLFVPDSGFIKQRFAIPFTIIALECSYDIEILQHRVDTNDINETLAKRIVENHTSKSAVLKYLTDFKRDKNGKKVKICDLSKCREIHLLHMSGDNIDKQQTKKDFEKRLLFIEIIIK